MNIIERGREFLQSLQAMAKRTVWDWKRCPQCGSMVTVKWGSYKRKPWFLSGRQVVKVHNIKVGSSQSQAFPDMLLMPLRGNPLPHGPKLEDVKG